MFEMVELAPPDAILGLTEAYKADPAQEKVNLGVGIYQNEEGQTPTLACVQKAEAWLAAGLDLNKIIIAPGIGFGKPSIQAMEIMSRCAELRESGLRLLIGHSRKSFMKGFRLNFRLKFTFRINSN